MNISQMCRVKPGRRARLKSYNPAARLGFKDREHCSESLEKNLRRLSELQQVLAADKRHALLVILQAVDAGGKDGTIRHVMSGVNPQGCEVTSFKAPSAEESAHDFLWRVHKAVPPRGDIGIFNRSHYEDVLVARVHNLVPKAVWSRRYEQINAFEKILAENSIRILKFFLHISREEQLKRFKERIADPTKNWKISKADFQERKHWNEYVAAYEAALTNCSTPWAPWFVIPANRKWARNFAVSQIIVETLEELRLKYPPAPIEVRNLAMK